MLELLETVVSKATAMGVKGLMLKGHQTTVYADDAMVWTTAIPAIVDDGVWRWLGSCVGEPSRA